MDEESFRERLNLEFEADSLNKLTNLGNQAISLGLISGHGYRGGKYEILKQGKFIVLSPEEAQVYLTKLIKEIGS